MKLNNDFNHSPVRLYGLPFAGGNGYSYRDFQTSLDHSIELITLELPGHGRKIQQTLLTNAEQAIDVIFDEIKASLDEKPYAIYGHSMGALLTYLLAKKIIVSNHRHPLHLFISGRKAPSSPKPTILKHQLPKQAFINYLKKLGGVPKEVLASPELLDFFEPILRADFELIECYQYQKMSHPFEIPLTVLYGTEDLSVKQNHYHD